MSTQCKGGKNWKAVEHIGHVNDIRKKLYESGIQTLSSPLEKVKILRTSWNLDTDRPDLDNVQFISTSAARGRASKLGHGMAPIISLNLLHYHIPFWHFQSVTRIHVCPCQLVLILFSECRKFELLASNSRFAKLNILSSLSRLGFSKLVILRFLFGFR